MSDEVLYENSYELETEDEIILCEVLVNFAQAEIAKLLSRFQAKSSTFSNYNKKKHLLSYLLNASDKCELDDFKRLYEADTSINDNDSLLAIFTRSDYSLVKTVSNFFKKLMLRLSDESTNKFIDYFDYLNEKEIPYNDANENDVQIKKEKSFFPIIRQQSNTSNLNRCTFCSFKHFSKSVVQCHISKNHLQHMRLSRFNKNINTSNNNVEENRTNDNNIEQSTFNEIFNENNTIVYNNQNISLGDTLFNDNNIENQRKLPTQMNESNNTSLTNLENKNLTKLPCQYCDKKFSFQSLLTQHIRIHTGEKPFKCKLCNKQFSQRPTLNRHFKIHTNDKSFKCEICSKLFIHRCNLNKHMESHFQKSEKRKSLNLSKSFNSVFNSLKRKERNRFNNIENNSTTSDLTISSINPIETPTLSTKYFCDFCPKAFSYQSQLEQHMRIHTGERPFTCDLCKKSFSQRPTLNRHLKTHNRHK